MANYNKSFNFRNGIQVDNDNFVVNANGLVGIGTTIPKNYLLNVHGDVNITGLITANNSILGVATISTLDATNVSASSSITAGTFYGSASGLTGIYGIAVDGWVVSGGNISTTSNVGIGTTLPVGNFQVGTGVTITTHGGATYSGIVTALSLDSIGLTGTKNLQVSGVSTFNSSIDLNSSIDISGHAELDQLNVSGVSTFAIAHIGPSVTISSGIVTATSYRGDGSQLTGIAVTANVITNSLVVSGVSTLRTLGVLGVTTTQHLQVSGVSTLSTLNVNNVYSSTGVITASNFVGSFTGTASTAQSLTGNPNITVSNVLASNIQSGVITATTRIYSESIGIGTTSSSSDIHVKRSGQAKIQITSDSAESIIGLGNSVSINGYNGLLRYGNTSGTFPYSTSNSLDVLNYGPGNVNFYLEASNVSAATTGSFYWHRKPNFARLMTLTYDGKLGIGNTLPGYNLEVTGNARVDSDAYFGNDVEVSNDLVVTNDLTVGNSFTFNGQYISANLEGNINSTSGVSTFYDLKVTNSSQIQSIGIGHSNPPIFDPVSSTYITNPLSINGGANNTFFVTTGGKVGVGTTAITGSYGIDGLTIEAGFKSVGVGTTSVRASVDFADAGKDYSSGQYAYMLPPRLNSSEIVGLSTVAGAIIYNTDTNTHQGYNGSGWYDLY